MSSHQPILSQIEIERCILQVSQAFTDIENQHENLQIKNIKSICLLHDSVIRTLSSKVDDSIARNHRYMMRLRLIDKLDEAIHIRKHIAFEADLYRAVALTSLYLLEKLPLAAHTSETVKTNLQTSYNKSQVLLNILQRIYVQCIPLNERNEEEEIPTTQPFLGLSLEKLQPVAIEENKGSIISFDREKLQMEEDELLKMANTPTPYENRLQNSQRDQNYNTYLIARLLLGEAKKDETVRPSLSVTFNDENGILRARDASNEEYRDSWWILTSESTISFESPFFTITSVLQNDFSTTSLSLNVGRDGDIWWEKVSQAITKLNESRDLQERIQRLWSDEECQIVKNAARNQVSSNASTLN